MHFPEFTLGNPVQVGEKLTLLLGRMKFALLLIGLMLLKGIELHRHKHGHESDTKQDEMRMPKPGTFKNKLVAKYGTNFRYLGKVKNGLDRVTVVTSIPIPRFEKKTGTVN